MTKIFFILFFVQVVLIAETYKVKDIDQFNICVKKANPGDIIILANGEWKDNVFKLSCNGEKGKPITMTAETPGKVIITGASQLKIGGNYLVVDGLYFKGGFIESGSVIEFRNGSKQTSNYSRLTNSAIEDYNPPDKNRDYKWISVYGKYNRVDHCYAKNKIHSGCLLVVWLSEEPNYAQIDSNYFAFRPPLGYNGAEIIRVGTSEWSQYPSYTTIEKNYFEDCNGEREIISNKSNNNTMRYNTFVRCQGTLTLRHGNNAWVEGNYFFGEHVKGTGGIRLIGENHVVINNYLTGIEGDDVFSPISFMNGVPNSPINRYFQVKNSIVAFNTLIDNKYGLTLGAGVDDELSLAPDSCTIANNIISSKNKAVILKSIPNNFNWNGNIIFGNIKGEEIDGYNVYADPVLEKDQYGIWRLTQNSPAISNAKGEFDFVKIDFDGQKRGLKKDIGCDQLSNEQKTNRPMNQSSTGPNWRLF